MASAQPASAASGSAAAAPAQPAGTPHVAAAARAAEALKAEAAAASSIVVRQPAAEQFVAAADVLMDCLPLRGRNQVEAQRALFLRQAGQIQALLAKQQELVGSDPQKASSSLQATAGGADPLALAGRYQEHAEVSQAARAAALNAAAEQTCLTVFSMQDTLTDAQAASLAKQVGCKPPQVQVYFARLRSHVRAFFQEALQPDAGPPRPPPSDAALKASDAAREAGFQRLSTCLTDGRVGDVAAAEDLLGLMCSVQSWAVREAALEAVARTCKWRALRRLSRGSKLLSTLGAWAAAAQEQRRTSLLRWLVRALRRLDLRAGRPPPRSAANALLALRSYSSPHVAAPATLLVERLGLLAKQGSPQPGWVALRTATSESLPLPSGDNPRKRRAAGKEVTSPPQGKRAAVAAAAGSANATPAAAVPKSVVPGLQFLPSPAAVAAAAAAAAASRQQPQPQHLQPTKKTAAGSLVQIAAAAQPAGPGQQQLSAAQLRAQQEAQGRAAAAQHARGLQELQRKQAEEAAAGAALGRWAAADLARSGPVKPALPYSRPLVLADFARLQDFRPAGDGLNSTDKKQLRPSCASLPWQQQQQQASWRAAPQPQPASPEPERGGAAAFTPAQRVPAFSSVKTEYDAQMEQLWNSGVRLLPHLDNAWPSLGL